jgi:hypothetical protein
LLSWPEKWRKQTEKDRETKNEGKKRKLLNGETQ